MVLRLERLARQAREDEFTIQLTTAERQRDEAEWAGEELCRIYFRIAAQFLPEDAIREQRDEMIAALRERGDTPQAGTA